MTLHIWAVVSELGRSAVGFGVHGVTARISKVITRIVAYLGRKFIDECQVDDINTWVLASLEK